MWQKMLQIGSGSVEPVDTKFWIFKNGEGLKNGVQVENNNPDQSEMTVNSQYINLYANNSALTGYPTCGCMFNIDLSQFIGQNKKIYLDIEHSNALNVSRIYTGASYPIYTGTNKNIRTTATREVDEIEIDSFIVKYCGVVFNTSGGVLHTDKIYNMWID